MPKRLPPATPQLNRLRAAAGLVPITEAGLTDARLSLEKAALMASFCEWSTESPPNDPEAMKLAQQVDDALKRIKIALSSAA